MVEYYQDDCFWDIESLPNVFTLATYYPKQNLARVYYVIDNKELEDSLQTQGVKDRIKAELPPSYQTDDFSLDLRSLKVPTNLKHLVRTFGLAFGQNNKDHYGTDGGVKDLRPKKFHNQDGSIRNNQAFADKLNEEALKQGANLKLANDKLRNLYHIKHTEDLPVITGEAARNQAQPKGQHIDLSGQFYAMKDTDPGFWQMGGYNQFGRRFGYNDLNYDQTMLSAILTSRGLEGLNKWLNNIPSDTELADDKKDKLKFPTANEIRQYNNQLFSPEFKNQMSSRLALDWDVSFNEFMNAPHKDKWNFYDYQSLAWNLRKAWGYTNRFVDVARLNEKMTRVGLKRLLAMLGRNVKEFERFDQELTPDNLISLIAYNISDVINLKWVLDHDLYTSNLNLRQALLNQFPETIYLPDPDEPMKPDQRADRIQRDRLTVNSTSAKFVEKIIAPYWHIKDEPVVDFYYPSLDQAKTLNVDQINVLDYCKNFFDKNFNNTPAQGKFDDIYRFYKSIEGKNFNDSEAYRTFYFEKSNKNKLDEDADDKAKAKPVTNAGAFFRQLMNDGKHFEAKADDPRYRIRKEEAYEKYTSDQAPESYKQIYKNEHEKGPNLDFYDKQGRPIGTNMKFGVGGIHGERYNLKAYQADRQAFEQKQASLKTIQNAVCAKYPTAKDLATTAYNDDTFAKGDLANIGLPNHQLKDFLKSNSTKKKAHWRVFKEPPLFKLDNKRFKLSDNYSWVTQLSKARGDQAIEADFKSYYPLLLTRMSVFKGDRDIDVYANLYGEKQKIDQEMKAPDLSDQDRSSLKTRRALIKLLLNSATGAANANFENNIRADNAIIAMRIIGQLFDWLVGQTMILESDNGSIYLGNTDAVYTEGINLDQAQTILDELNQTIHVDIDPVLFDRTVSKDSNNKIVIEDGHVKAGGNLKAYERPSLEQNLDHPAIIDRLIGDYLLNPNRLDVVNQPFDRFEAERLLSAIERHYLGVNVTDQTQAEDVNPEGLVDLLIMYQNITVASPKTDTFNVLNTTPIDKRTQGSPVSEEDVDSYQPINRMIENLYQKRFTLLNHYERLFFVKTNNKLKNYTPQTVHQVTHRKDKRLEWINAGGGSEDTWDILQRELCEHILRQKGVRAGSANDILNGEADYDNQKERAKFMKVRGIPTNQYVVTYNQDLHEEATTDLLNVYKSLDKDTYLDQMESSFKDNWSNPV